MKNFGKLEVLLWSIGLPGFSQLLMGQFFKGLIFIVLEFLVNMNSHFNSAILLSFLGEIDRASEVVNYQWLMFYPCLYMFAIWDAYRHIKPETEKYSYLPFVFGAYFITIGLIYSRSITIFGKMLGPVFLPMLFLIPGLFSGFLLKFILLKHQS